MDLREQAKAQGEDPDQVVHPSMLKGNQKPKEEGETTPTTAPEIAYDASRNPIERPILDQEATSRALKPHSRSVTALNQLYPGRPETMTAIKDDGQKSESGKRSDPSKPKPKKWQFGIRSRNAPYEAMKCIFQALHAMDATWLIDPITASDGNGDDKGDPPPPPPDGIHKILQSKYPHLPPDYYIPREPWLIRSRILKKGLYLPGEAPTLSSHSSAVSLPAEAQQQMKKHLEELAWIDEEFAEGAGMAKPKSLPGSGDSSRPTTSRGDALSSQEAFTGPPSFPKHEEIEVKAGTKGPSDAIGVWVYVDIQLYMLETNTYVVDFKCDGYQNVVLIDPGKEKVKEKEDGGDESESDSKPYWKPTTKRYKNKEKEISSPFPYLDVASELIAHLAG